MPRGADSARTDSKALIVVATELILAGCWLVEWYELLALADAASQFETGKAKTGGGGRPI